MPNTFASFNQKCDFFEMWLAIDGFEGFYEVSSSGRVRRIDVLRKTSDGILKQSVTGRHYAIVNLTKGGKNTRYCALVHNLVARAFIGSKPSGYCINHVDGNKTNNAAYNLEYVTPAENRRHAVQCGLIKRPLTAEQVREIRSRKGKGLGAIRLGRELGVGHSTVMRIWLGQAYSDVT